MAAFEDLQRQAGFTGGPSGTPRSSQVPGAPPRPSMPNNFVNPPSPASGPVGRPPTPPTAAFTGGAGSPLPVSGANPAPASGSSGAGGSVRPPMPPSGSNPGNPTKQMTAGPISPDSPAGAQPVFMDRVPNSMERAEMPPGSKIMTPYGEIGADGRVVTTPETEQRYREAMVQRQKKYGATPWSNDPTAPQPEVRLGGWSFNPFAPRNLAWVR